MVSCDTSACRREMCHLDPEIPDKEPLLPATVLSEHCGILYLRGINVL